MREREGRRGASGVIWEVKGGAKEKKRSKEAEREKAATDGDEKRVVAAKRKEAKRPCSIRRLCKPLGSCLCQLRCSRDVRVQRARCGGLKSSKSRRKRHGEDVVFSFFPSTANESSARSLAAAPRAPLAENRIQADTLQALASLHPFQPQEAGDGTHLSDGRRREGKERKGGRRKDPFFTQKRVETSSFVFFICRAREVRLRTSRFSSL